MHALGRISQKDLAGVFPPPFSRFLAFAASRVVIGCFPFPYYPPDHTGLADMIITMPSCTGAPKPSALPVPSGSTNGNDLFLYTHYFSKVKPKFSARFNKKP
jgi:hypothetical protein